ncbi:hypothetical protein [Nonlabens sp.]|uniref:hypothetical protein n=1 Tax=Nonlabens sp. TaxID=1888209 RepID=UPI00326432E5
MKLRKTLKIVLYSLTGFFVLSSIASPISSYIAYGGVQSSGFKTSLLFTVINGVSGVLICYHGAMVLKSFETISFENMSNSLQQIGYTLLSVCPLHNIINYFTAAVRDAAYWIPTLGYSLIIVILGFFLLAISQIIKKADYYKTENDLTI